MVGCCFGSSNKILVGLGGDHSHVIVRSLLDGVRASVPVWQVQNIYVIGSSLIDEPFVRVDEVHLGVVRHKRKVATLDEAFVSLFPLAVLRLLASLARLALLGP